mgnify:FL=1
MVWENYRSWSDENGKDRESMLCYRKMREQGIL